MMQNYVALSNNEKINDNYPMESADLFRKIKILKSRDDTLESIDE